MQASSEVILQPICLKGASYVAMYFVLITTNQLGT